MLHQILIACWPEQLHRSEDDIYMPLVKKVHRATIRYPVFNGTGIPALDQDFGGMLRSTKRAVSSWELASLRCLKAIDFEEKTVIVWRSQAFDTTHIDLDIIYNIYIYTIY